MRSSLRYAHVEKLVVIRLPVPFEVGAQVEQGTGSTFVAQRNRMMKEAPDPAVPVEVRVDSLELVVQQGALDQRWHLEILVREELPVSHRFADVRRRWGH